MLLDGQAHIYDYLDRKSVEALIEDHLEGRENRRLLIWSLLSVEAWCQEFLRVSGTVLIRIIADFRGHIAAINEAAHIIFLNRQLAAVLVRREIAEPHAGQLFGWFWAVVHPLFLMAVYAVVFNLIFRARIGGPTPCRSIIRFMF